VNFTLVDSIGKKINIVTEVAKSINLTNVTALNQRAETIPDQFDFVVSRAVTDMSVIIGWVKGKIKKQCINDLSNGLLYLKGGDFLDELKALKKPYKIYELPDYFEEEFFETKKLVYVGLV
jgi:16S rRNA (guanine527-N7)-methyltransferase